MRFEGKAEVVLRTNEDYARLPMQIGKTNLWCVVDGFVSGIFP